MKFFARQSPWYVAGLAFECVGCGRCCAGPAEGYVWVTDEEIAAIAEHLDMSEEETRLKYVRRVGRRHSLVERKDSKDCIFLTPDSRGEGGRGCRIYPVRPTQCRTWPFWPHNVSSPDGWAVAGRRCPGINRGERLFTQDEIEEQVKATRR